ncbi:S53 family peptidase [Lichenicola sp.]|uniref:S53 family peptidase n=1 Tax=Lichenicola sp. TaxID=2804529 RepID=UPI003B004FD4
MRSNKLARRAGLGCALVCLTTAGANAATGGGLVPALVSETSLTTLSHSRPDALASATDQGALAANHPLQHLQLALKRPADRQAALDALVLAQTTKGSSAYHAWLTPAQLRDQYGPAASDIAATEKWMQSHGLTVNSVSPTGMSIDFSGTAATVGAAFHTTLHSYSRNGLQHFAASGDQSFPSALSPVVSGAVLSNFFPHPLLQAARKPTAAKLAGAKVTKVGTSYTMAVGGTTYYAVTPADFHTIYDENVLFNGSSVVGKVTGAGVTVAVAEQTDIRAADVQSFRSQFGLSSYKGTLQLTHPGGCEDPGFTGDEGEAALDAEWSGAVAPDATIIEASCSSSETGFGVMTALQNLIEGGTTASAISVSYGGSEVGNGIVFLTEWSNLVEEGAAEGISIFVSTGDGAADIADTGATLGTSGVNVNGLASNVYDTAVGGTDFGDTVEGLNGYFWSASNSTTGGSANSYVPEIPWDNSCGSYVNWAGARAAGPLQNCNNPQTTASYQNVVGGSGGQSLLFAKPSWQSTKLPGMPNDGARDLPDISLFASNGQWNHFYLECMSDTAEGGVPCTYTNPTNFFGSAFGGTSFAAPDFAGIAALVAQLYGKVGNMAPALYQIGQIQYTNSRLVQQCQTTSFPANPLCVFHNVAVGDNSVACQAGTPNCYTNALSTKGIGVTSTSTSTLSPAFSAGVGYNLATGLGSVDIPQLLLNF